MQYDIKSDDGGGREKTTRMDLPGNSHKQRNAQKKEAEEQPSEKRVEKVIEGVAIQRKRPLLKRISESFTGEDMKSVIGNVFWDVVIPAVKDMVYDSITQGIQRILFDGESRTRTTRRGYNTSHTSYDKMYKDGASRRELSYRARARHDFGELVLESRAEAQEAIDAMNALIDTYGQATVADLYAAVGISGGSFVDNRWGWTSMSGARVVRTMDGYLLNLPRPEEVEG